MPSGIKKPSWRGSLLHGVKQGGGGSRWTEVSVPYSWEGFPQSPSVVLYFPGKVPFPSSLFKKIWLCWVFVEAHGLL